jgi:hypothetical protein
MFGPGRELVARARSQVREDVRADPYLLYILVGATLLASFWFWHRIPNFATRDERSRLLDAMVPYGRVLAEPSFQSLQEGVAWSRVPFGATLYVFGLAMLPAVVYAILTGQADIFVSVGFPDWEFGYYPVWAETPRWVWTSSLVLVRLFNVAFAVGCVYLTYRLGTAMADRFTGRLAAIILTLTFGFLTIAHEGGEDMPALFFVLLAVNLVYLYVQSGDVAAFFAGSAAGGAAIAFKLTAAPVVLVVGAAHLLRAVKSEEDTVDALLAPKVVVGGATLGAVTIGLGFPTLLVVGPEPFIERVFGGSMGRMNHATGPDAPITWWFLRGYFSGMGLPLFFASVTGVLASVERLRKRRESVYGTLLVLLALSLYVLLFSRWHDFRVHHLLPTFPLLALLLARSYTDARERWQWDPRILRGAMAVLLVTTAIYAGVGTLGFASMPRDQAEAWLVENADEDDTMQITRRSFQDAAVPHGMGISHVFGREDDGEVADPCPEYIQLGYRDMLYLQPGTYYRNGEAQRTYVTDLLTGEYNYEIAAEFGTRPGRQRFGPVPDDGPVSSWVPNRATPGDYGDLLRYGIVPQTDQFADEQELAANQYTVILERTEPCTSPHTAPF